MFGFRGRTSGPVAPTNLAVVGFGKLPFAGDFLRTAGYADTIQKFELFLTRAMEWADGHRRGFREAYAAGGVQAFAYRMPSGTKDPSILVGVMKPSQDAVGRRFPIAVALRAPLAPFEGSPFLLPLVFEPFLEHASEILLRSGHWRGLPDFQEEINRIPPIELSMVATLANTYQGWLRAGTIGEVWQALFGPTAHVMAPVAVSTVVDATAPFRGRELPPTPLGVLLPIGEAGSTGAAFWLDAVARSARWSRTVPTYFWGASGSLLVQLGDDVPTTIAADLWCPDDDSPHVYSVVASQASGSARGLAPHLLAAIDGHRPVGDLLGSLGA